MADTFLMIGMWMLFIVFAIATVLCMIFFVGVARMLYNDWKEERREEHERHLVHK
jgi:hypothetical protein